MILLLSILRANFIHVLRDTAEVIWTLDSPSVQAIYAGKSVIAIFYRKDEDKGGYHGSFVTVSSQEGPFQSVSCLNDVWDVKQVKVSLPSPLQ